MKNLNNYKRIAIKVGSNVLTRDEGVLDIARIAHLVDQIGQLMESGIEIILISSGAVAAGRNGTGKNRKLDTISSRQLWSAIGQVKLMNRYYDLFGEINIQCAQVLTTKENFSDRRHYLNMKNCIETMLENSVVPVVNENDTISVTELMFTDNDELSGLISSMLKCDALFILSNIDGVFNGNPNDKDSKLIAEIDTDCDKMGDFIVSQKSNFGRGGMLTKCNIARKIAKEGIAVYIANGLRNKILTDIVTGEDVPFSLFVPGEKQKKSVKKWLAHSDDFAKGEVVVNQGAKEALGNNKAASLLMIGILNVKGFFEKGDIVSIKDEDGKSLGLGKAQYSSKDADNGKGKKARKPFIHYDYLHLYDDNES